MGSLFFIWLKLIFSAVIYNKMYKYAVMKKYQIRYNNLLYFTIIDVTMCHVGVYR